MSWDKQTINNSKISTIIKLLQQLGIDYKNQIYQKVIDRGAFSNPEELISLNILEFYNQKGNIQLFIDVIQRTHDCDSNDIITTIEKENITIEEFLKDEDFEYDYYVDEEDDHDYDYDVKGDDYNIDGEDIIYDNMINVLKKYVKKEKDIGFKKGSLYIISASPKKG